MLLKFYIWFLSIFLISICKYYPSEKNIENWGQVFKASMKNMIMILPISLLPYNIPIKKFTLSEIPEIYIISEFLFWVIHRIMHTNILYRILHKQHHLWNENIISPAVFDAHPVDFLVCNILPFAIPLFWFPHSDISRRFMIAIATYSAVSSHHMKTQSPHYFHHRLRKVNYSFGFHIFDRIFGTYFNPNFQ